MARPRKNIILESGEGCEGSGIVAGQIDNRMLASFLQLHAGVDRLGASLSISLQKNASEIVMGPYGAIVKGKKSDRKVLIPYANIRGAELI